MPLYPGPDIATFTTYFKAGEGPPWSTTTYWQAASTQISQANALAAAEAYHTQFAEVVSLLLATSVKVASTRVRVFLSGSLIEAEHAEEIPGAGGTAEALPRQDCIVIQRRTASFGRSYQGRIFLSGIAEAVQTNGEISNASRADAKEVATFLGADRTFNVPFHARHWNRKMNTFVPISACYAVIELKSRRDRQYYKASTKI